ncbi:hypothetical protein V6L80_00150 (plasmid) [Erwinia persicina]|uniref:hypothetical protein n=1 Tax=Erwinia persicina TaxID=55211 RepID=UPI0030CF9045
MAIEHVIKHAIRAVERQQQCTDLIIKVSLYELTQGRGLSESWQHVQECVIPALVQASGQYAACAKLGLSDAVDTDFFPVWHEAERLFSIAAEQVRILRLVAHYLTDEQIETLIIEGYE